MWINFSRKNFSFKFCKKNRFQNLHKNPHLKNQYIGNPVTKLSQDDDEVVNYVCTTGPKFTLISIQVYICIYLLFVQPDGEDAKTYFILWRCMNWFHSKVLEWRRSFLAAKVSNWWVFLVVVVVQMCMFRNDYFGWDGLFWVGGSDGLVWLLWFSACNCVYASVFLWV